MDGNRGKLYRQLLGVGGWRKATIKFTPPPPLQRALANVQKIIVVNNIFFSNSHFPLSYGDFEKWNKGRFDKKNNSEILPEKPFFIPPLTPLPPLDTPLYDEEVSRVTGQDKS